MALIFKINEEEIVNACDNLLCDLITLRENAPDGEDYDRVIEALDKLREMAYTLNRQV